MKKSTTVGALVALGLTFGAASVANATTACANTDITKNAEDCRGFFDGNLLNSSHITEQHNALAALGFTWDDNFLTVTKISGLGGLQTVDFGKLMVGETYVAFHFGNGKGGPGQATAFYRFDAGAGTETLDLLYKASSDAVLYSTGVAGGVPEPATWALMMGGFGLMGVALRRRSAFAPTAI